MSHALTTLDSMNQALHACEQGQLAQTALIKLWRTEAKGLPLPARFSEVLEGLLDRIEASALFSEESCSFSQRGLLEGLHLWSDKARAQCLRHAAPGVTNQTSESIPPEA